MIPRVMKRCGGQDPATFFIDKTWGLQSDARAVPNNKK
jgi:hypothetical protein